MGCPLLRTFFCLFLSSYFVFAFDEEQYLNQLQAEKSSIDKEKISDQIYREEIRPRGASYSGDVALFEKRVFFLNKKKIFFILFDLKEKKRLIYEIPSYQTFQKRKELLNYFRTNYQYEEARIITRNLNLGNHYVTSKGVIYKSFIKRDKHLFYYIEVLEWEEDKRVLLARYPMPIETINEPTISSFYVFDGELGFAIKMKFETLDKDNKNVQFKEDILCFNKKFNFENNPILNLENAYELSSEQQKLTYLTDVVFDFKVKAIFRKEYYLSGQFILKKAN